ATSATRPTPVRSRRYTRRLPAQTRYIASGGSPSRMSTCPATSLRTSPHPLSRSDQAVERGFRGALRTEYRHDEARPLQRGGERLSFAEGISRESENRVERSAGGRSPGASMDGARSVGHSRLISRDARPER